MSPEMPGIFIVLAFVVVSAQLDDSCYCDGGGCLHGCCSYEFACDQQCISSAKFCDREDDCRDGSDQNLTGPGLMCLSHFGKRCVLPEAYVCDNRPFCRDAEDECNNDCANVELGFFCNGQEECKNGIDECLCEGNRRSEEIYADDKCFRCFDDSVTIHSSELCDGVIHCNDVSDECLCGRQTDLPICSRIQWDEMYRSFLCRVNGIETSFDVKRICDRRTDCDSGIDEANCAKDNSTTEDDSNAYICREGSRETGLAVKCDGIPECENLDDECKGCNNTPEYCQFTHKVGFYCVGRDRNSLIHGRQVCNGVEDCGTGGRDEKYCSNSTRFYCNKTSTTKNIENDKVCDLRNDCEDSNDEVDCQVKCENCKRCPNKHFYCEAGGKEFVDCRRQVCDGSKDCFNGADECQGCTVGIFSDDDRMIAATAALPFLWLISFVATVGNLIVMSSNIYWITTQRKHHNESQTGQRILILNLSTADLLVGIYTLSVSIQNVNLSSGRYCQHDHEWRSSSTCNALGVILTAGCESSVFVMALITAYRLNSVYRPFSRAPQRRMALIAVISWMLALIIALVPLSKSAEDYFVESKWFGRNPIVRTVNREELANYTNRLVSLRKLDAYFVKENGGFGSWRLFERALRQINPDYVVQREFGYYSAHGVCLPKLFPYPSEDAAWGYTFFVILLNFVLFLFICISYVLIYRKATGVKILHSDEQAKRNAALQRKITRMVVSDFLCWIPVCIIAFLRFGGVKITDDVYVPVGTILIPINSMLNPFLYSALPDWIRQKASPLCKVICPQGKKRESHQLQNVQRVSSQASGSRICGSRPTAEETLDSHSRSNK